MCKPEVSAIVIAQDEAANIERCLRSLWWVDELIVIDGGSGDNTFELARKYTENVFVNAWPGYARQRQYALAKATKGWVFSVDADEEISPALANEIRLTLSNAADHNEGYQIARLSKYLGVWIYHGELYPDLQMRLFRQNKASVRCSHVHEGYIVSKPLETLNNPIYHYSYSGVKDHYARMKKYAGLKALDLNESGIKWSLHRTITETLSRGGNNFFILRGYRDGYISLIISFMLMYYVFRTHTQLYVLQRKS